MATSTKKTKKDVRIITPTQESKVYSTQSFLITCFVFLGLGGFFYFTTLPTVHQIYGVTGLIVEIILIGFFFSMMQFGFYLFFTSSISKKEYKFHENRLVYDPSVLYNNPIVINYNRITDVKTSQNLLEKRYKLGTVIIKSSDKTVRIKHLENYLKTKEEIQKLIRKK